MTKIVHVCLSMSIKDNPITNAMRESGAEVVELDYFSQDGTKRINTNIFSRTCQQVVSEYRPDFVFMQIQEKGIISLPYLQEMVKICPVLCWTGDVRDDVDFQLEIANLGVMCLFNNEEDVKTLNNHGYRSEYLQIGFHKGMFKPYPNQQQTLGKVVFIGNNYGLRFPLGEERILLCKALKDKYEGDFGLYGLGWDTIGIKADGVVEYKNIPSIYNQYLIGINHSNYYRSGYTSDRLFHIVGLGNFCLSHNYPKIEQDFTINEHLCVYDSVEDCLNLIEFWLDANNTERRIQIAKNASEHAHKNLTWDRRIKELYQIVNKHYNLSLPC